MKTLTETAELVLLAEAAYGNFISEGRLISDKSKIIDSLKESGMSGDEQASLVINNWDIVAHWQDKAQGISDTESGFSATVFQSKKDARHVLAVKGTAGMKDLIVADIADIVRDGLAMDQIIDLYNFWQQINAGKNQSYRVATLVNEFDMNAIWNNPAGHYVFDQPSGNLRKIVFTSSDLVYDDERAGGLGMSIDTITVTGHSLGGHLAAAFSRLFPGPAGHCVMVNGAGFGTDASLSAGHAAHNISALFQALGGAASFDSSKITNIIAENYLDFISQDWAIGLSQPGTTVEILTEYQGAVDSHSVTYIVDTVSVMALFAAVSPDISRRPLQEAFNSLTGLIQSGRAAQQDDSSLENIVMALERVYFGPSEREMTIDDRNMLYQQITRLQKAINAADNGVVVMAKDLSADEMVTRAQADIAYRSMLFNLVPFAIEGIDYTDQNKKGELALYNHHTHSGMTLQYLRDRADILHETIKGNLGEGQGVRYTEVDGIQRYSFIAADKNDPDNSRMRSIIFFPDCEQCKIDESHAQGDSYCNVYNTAPGADEHVYFGLGRNKVFSLGENDYLQGGPNFDEYYIVGNSGKTRIFDTVDISGDVIFSDDTSDVYEKHHNIFYERYLSHGNRLFFSENGDTILKLMDPDNGRKNFWNVEVKRERGRGRGVILIDHDMMNSYFGKLKIKGPEMMDSNREVYLDTDVILLEYLGLI